MIEESLRSAQTWLAGVAPSQQQDVYREIFRVVGGPCTHGTGPKPQQICRACCDRRDEALVEIWQAKS